MTGDRINNDKICGRVVVKIVRVEYIRRVTNYYKKSRETNVNFVGSYKKEHEIL